MRCTLFNCTCGSTPPSCCANQALAMVVTREWRNSALSLYAEIFRRVGIACHNYTRVSTQNGDWREIINREQTSTLPYFGIHLWDCAPPNVREFLRLRGRSNQLRVPVRQRKCSEWPVMPRPRMEGTGQDNHSLATLGFEIHNVLRWVIPTKLNIYSRPSPSTTRHWRC